MEEVDHVFRILDSEDPVEAMFSEELRVCCRSRCVNPQSSWKNPKNSSQLRTPARNHRFSEPPTSFANAEQSCVQGMMDMLGEKSGSPRSFAIARKPGMIHCSKDSSDFRRGIFRFVREVQECTGLPRNLSERTGAKNVD